MSTTPEQLGKKLVGKRLVKKWKEIRKKMVTGEMASEISEMSVDELREVVGVVNDLVMICRRDQQDRVLQTLRNIGITPEMYDKLAPLTLRTESKEFLEWHAGALLKCENPEERRRLATILHPSVSKLPPEKNDDLGEPTRKVPSENLDL